MRPRDKTSGRATKAKRQKKLTRRNPSAGRRKSPSAKSETNVERLTRELRQRTDDLSASLEQQTATSEILKIISSSPGSPETAFTAILDNACRICGASFGSMLLREGTGTRRVALHNAPLRFAEFNKHTSLLPRGSAPTVDRALDTKQMVHVPDLSSQDFISPLTKYGGARTVLVVPMVKDAEAIGVIGIYRQEVQPFTGRQITLVQNFAAQAVIAIENARLLNELRQRTDDLSEALEQQTATSEVLRVISSSPGVLAPVFNAMLENAVRICEASFGVLHRYEDNRWRATAMYNVPEAFANFWNSGPHQPGPGSGLGRVAETRQPVHIADVTKEPAYIEGEPVFVAAVNLGGFRTVINMPLLKEERLIGCFTIYRQEVRLFDTKQVELLQNFAAQAVIAIENTRLLNELRESLEQQTAISEVLSIISSSPGKLDPVFDAILQNATRICEAQFGNLFLREGNKVRAVAVLGIPSFVETWRANPLMELVPSTARGVAGLARQFAQHLDTGEIIQILDMREDEGYRAGNPRLRELVDVGGARTFVTFPMMRDDQAIGTIGMYRQEVRPFTDKQVELMKSFAKQAVIAIENTRLLTELRQRTDDLSESLEQQTATSEVLKVISNSPGVVAPVFNAMLESAVESAVPSSVSCSNLMAKRVLRWQRIICLRPSTNFSGHEGG